MANTDGAPEISDSGGFLSKFVSELVQNPVNLALLGVCGYLLYRIVKSRQDADPPFVPDEGLPPFPKKDMTVEEMRQYDGKQPDGRILMAANGKIFDVTRGKKFYGPDGPYGVFAGRDASRGLATFSLTEDILKDGYDDLSDLSPMEMDSVRDWEMQFAMKYDYVGLLLKPDQPSDGEKKVSDPEKAATDSDTSANDSGKPKSDSEKPKSDSEKPKSDSDTSVNDSGKPRSDSEKPKSDSDMSVNDSGKPKNDSEKPTSDSDTSVNDSRNTLYDSEKPTTGSKKTK